jgi:hypothetical protein
MKNNKMIINSISEISKEQIVLDYLKSYAKRKLSQGKTKARELFPKLEIISAHCNLPIDDTISIINNLEKQGEIIRFYAHRYIKDVWISIQTRLKQKKVIKKEKIVKPEIIKEPVKEITKENLPVIKGNKFKIDKILAFKIIIFVVFIAFLYLGIKYNFISFYQTKDFYDALISAIGFFVFSIVSFECFILFIINKKYILSLAFLLIFIVIFISNFITILESQFEKYQDYTFSDTKITQDNNSILYKEYQKQEKEFEIELDNRIEERNKLNIDIKNKWTVWNITNKQIPDIQNKLKEIRVKKENILLNNTIVEKKKITIYELIADLFKTETNNIQFILLIFRALTIDLIASISLALIFFLKDEKVKKKRKKF